MKFENLTGKQFRGTRISNGKRLEDGTRGVGKLWKNRIGGYERSRADDDLMYDVNEVPRREKLLSRSLAAAEFGNCGVTGFAEIGGNCAQLGRVCQITGHAIPEGEVTVVCWADDSHDSDQVLVVSYNRDSKIVSSVYMTPRRAFKLPGVVDLRYADLD